MENIDDRAWLEPPDYQEKAIYKCFYFETGIYEGDSYYEIEGEILCEECLDDKYKFYD